MKRILAMILSYIFALMNNVEYTASEMPLFSPASYYMFEDETSKTAREIYIEQTGAEGKSRTTSEEATPKTICQSDEEHEANKYDWFVAQNDAPTYDTVTSCEKGGHTGMYVWTGSEGSKQIVCPINSHVVNNLAQDVSGRELTLESTDGEWRFEFTNLERRFTETHRSDTPGDGGDWNNCGNISKDYVLKKGYLVGYSQAGTQVVVKRKTEDGSWENCSLTDFYYRT